VACAFEHKLPIGKPRFLWQWVVNLNALIFRDVPSNPVIDEQIVAPSLSRLEPGKVDA
jgi:hypothetical protein